MTMTVAESGPPVDASPICTSRWRRRVLLVTVVVLVAGGLATYWSLRSHYRDAAPLSCACGLRWAEPDAAHVRDVQAGPWDAEIVTARPGDVQAFEVLLVNRSSVTQTIVGGNHDDGQTVEPVEVTFARPAGSVSADQDEKTASDFSETAAVLPPGGVRWVRYAIHTASHNAVGGPWPKGRTESFTALDLKVRIGAWTRWEHIEFSDFAFVLSGT